MILRLDQLVAPAAAGTQYLVPTVVGMWRGVIKAWPIIGPKHNDTQCLKFEWDHYHLDPRFIYKPVFDPDFWRDVQAAPLMSRGALNEGGLPKPVWLKRHCWRLENPSRKTMEGHAIKHASWRCHFDQWTGKQARRDDRGWICPHRSVSLADHQPIDGVITCPLHLLRIDSRTGLVLPPESEAA